MERSLPHSRVKNVRIFYLLTVFVNGWFISANWIFLALTMMSQSRLGLIDGASFIVGTLFDLPSGALADLIGRKRTIIIARLFLVVAGVIFILSRNQWIFALANVLFFIGTSFYAGADQALLYDSLKKEGLEKDYLAVNSRLNLITQITTFATALVGAYAFSLNIRYPFVLLTFFAVLALIVSFFLEETDTVTRHPFSLAVFFRQQTEGIRVLLGRKLRVFFPIFFVILGTLIVFQWGILRGFMAIEYGFNGSEQSTIFGTLAFATGILSLYLPHLVSRSSEARMTVLFSAVYITGFMLFGYFTGSKAWGILVLFLIALSGNILNILAQKIVNDQVVSKNRATALSALSIVTKIPYMFLAYPVGFLAEAHLLTTITRAIALAAAFAVGVLLLTKRYTAAVKSGTR